MQMFKTRLQSHIEYAIDFLKKNTIKVRNIKSYLLTALYNSLAAIGLYYTAEVNHDFYGIREEKKLNW